MPFSFRDKQKPSDKLGGDDFMNGVRKQFDQDRKMFFDKNPTWESTPSASGFSRGGFFDDERGGLGIRSHLDDLAQRHPEFASSLRRGPAWGAGPAGSQWEDNVGQQPPQTSEAPVPREVPMESDAANDAASSEQRDEAGPLRGRTRPSATATDVPAQGEGLEAGGRGQRSWSAPPDSRAPPPATPQRFVTRLDFQPQQPEQQPQAPPAPTSEGGPKPGAVRHIPIFVEGRDEPVVPKERPFPAQEPRVARQPTQHQEPARSFNSSPQPFRNSSNASSPVAPPPPSTAGPAPSASPAPAPSPAPLDGMAKVAAVANAVEELHKQVASYAGAESRADKQYVLLDELLTRRLLELDDVEPAGREDVRQARRQAIRAVQDCISQLEAKVPLPASDCPPAESDESMPATDAPAS